MTTNSVGLLYVLAIAATLSIAISLEDGVDEAPQTYIVHMSRAQMPSTFESPQQWHSSLLNSLFAHEDGGGGSQGVLYDYNQVFHGFAAKLTLAQAEALEKTDGILSVQTDRVYHLHTTRTPQFLGLDSKGGLRITQSKHSQDVIVGVLDSGVWPESKSFSDDGMDPVPSRWKGECESGTQFNASHCNKKLIGARFFSKGYEAATGPLNEAEEYRSPRDDDGHGTHTSSTAAGSLVNNASLFGFASGTAGGMAPGARVAIYKVCWSRGCVNSDILAAMDKAVEDGVNILSLSLGSRSEEYDKDGVALGSFAAVQKGIFVACSAGNSGPDPMSVQNVAPWITTVAASTLDRSFPADVVLGDGSRYDGVSLYSGTGLPKGKLLPLISAASAGNGNRTSKRCLENTLDANLVKGKIVMCDRGSNSRVEKGSVVKSAGGVGMILANTEDEGDELVADSHFLPAAAVGFSTRQLIEKYINTTARPTASIEIKGTVVDTAPAPVLAAFSSRGPNALTAQILKPDITGPGVGILASWTGAAGPSGLKVDKRRVEFNIISGTSMSCPHVSGIAALIKAAHPKWSPAAIRSALMTTAYHLDNTGKPLRDVATGVDSTPFDHGAGHVDPNRAVSPGLIYDIGTQDYVDFLCAISYTSQQIATITRTDNTSCAQSAGNPGNINYPSFAVVFENVGTNSSEGVKYRRTVTNVGAAPSKYNVTIAAPPGVSIVVTPTKLAFRRLNEKKSYNITFQTLAGKHSSRSASFGSITWTDGVHKVRSPVAVRWKL